MLFRRREKLGFWAKMRALWPRRSWSRALQYLQKRVLRLRATPHAIAAGFAAGVFASFTPFLGFHIILAFAIAYLIAGNMAAVVLACTVCGNPITYPFIWASTYELGRYMLGAETTAGPAPEGLGHALEHMNLLAIWEPILKPMLIGSLPLGIAFALVGYGLVYATARSFQQRRAHRLTLRARAANAVPATRVGPAEEAL
jgi:uncharacterized protein (DUF2062 family)